MADTQEQVAAKQKAFRANCPHPIIKIISIPGFAGSWVMEICTNCGTQTGVYHDCQMQWNEEGTALTCPTCKADGT